MAFVSLARVRHTTFSGVQTKYRFGVCLLVDEFIV